MSKPNFLIFITDQMRSDHMGCSSNDEIHTPNIDAIAENGILFSNAYVSNPICMPARATLFTGMTPRGHQVRTNGINLRQDVVTLPTVLKKNGYRTHSIGKLHLQMWGTPKGVPKNDISPELSWEMRELWDNKEITELPEDYYGLTASGFIGGHPDWLFGEYINWLESQDKDMPKLLRRECGEQSENNTEQWYKMKIPASYHYTRWIGDKAIDFITREGSGAPFFLWCSFPDPHHPFAAPEPYASMYDAEKLRLPTRKEGELENLPPHYKKIFNDGLLVTGRRRPTKMSDINLREIKAMTYGMISFIDDEIGRIMKKLEECGLVENTVVVFLSDHGDMLGDHFIVNKGPFHFDGLLKMPYIWSCPTQLGTGRINDSLVSQLDFMPTVLDLAGAEMEDNTAYYHQFEVTTFPPLPGKSIKEILTGAKESVNESILVEMDEDYLPERLRTLVTPEYKITVYQGREYGELFDRKNDTMEHDNLWDDPGHRGIKDELRVKLLDKIIETESVLPRRLSNA